MKISLLLLAFIALQTAFGQDSGRSDSTTQSATDTMRIYTTARLTGNGPVIDGRFDDPAWDQIEWGGDGFRQISPDKGKPTTVQTRFKIFYDAKNLYVAIKCLDPSPEKIARRMSRRDPFEGDFVEINPFRFVNHL